jgi:aspartyl-tRNA synthetase
MHRYRTHRCGEPTKGDVASTARLSGWVHRKRDHGQLLFIDLRDHTGLTQIVVQPETPFFAEAEALRLESVITVTGKVVARTPETVNPDLKTGEIEVVAETMTVESLADVLPLQVNAERDYPEETRLTYRFLDLRREKMQRQIRLRSAVTSSIRRRMTDLGFTEIQTPILTASSPEGARDFLVPSRIHPGRFYALPQAPQQYKQLLMMSGFDRYFQIAPCFRDEDARADRSPGEFYQLDLEMAFATQEDVFAAVEPVMHGLFEEFSDWAVTPMPFPHIAYKDAIRLYGTDKPDLRNPIQMRDVSERSAIPASRSSPISWPRTPSTRSGRSRPGWRQPCLLRPDERLGARAGPAGAGLRLLQGRRGLGARGQEHRAGADGGDPAAMRPWRRRRRLLRGR